LAELFGQVFSEFSEVFTGNVRNQAAQVVNVLVLGGKNLANRFGIGRGRIVIFHGGVDLIGQEKFGWTKITGFGIRCWNSLRRNDQIIMTNATLKPEKREKILCF
jgi:hypothetical protein